jgi:hypothetical protein
MPDIQLDAAAMRSLYVRGSMVDKHIERLAKETYDISQLIVPQPGRERPPADATGRLKQSGRLKKSAQRSWDVEYQAPYAVYVELGTRHMRPEPYLRPALLAVIRAHG